MDLSTLPRSILEQILKSLLAKAPVALPGQAGSLASMIPLGAPTVQVSGLSGMSASSVGRQLALGGAAAPENDGVFLITGFVDPTTVEIRAAGTSAPDANNGALYWVETTSGTASALISPLVTELVTAKADLAQCILDRDTLQGQVGLYQDVVVPGGSGDPVGPAFSTVTNIGAYVIDYAWTGLAFEYYEFAIGAAGYSPADPKIATPVDPADTALAAEVLRMPVTKVEDGGGSTSVVRCRIPDTVFRGIGEFGIFARIVNEPGLPAVPAFIPQTLGDVFLLALSHFPMACYGPGRKSVERLAITF